MLKQHERTVTVQDPRAFPIRAVVFLPVLIVTLVGLLVQFAMMPFMSVARFGLFGGLVATLGGVVDIAINLIMTPIASAIWLFNGKKNVPESVARSLDRKGWRITSF